MYPCIINWHGIKNEYHFCHVAKTVVLVTVCRTKLVSLEIFSAISYVGPNAVTNQYFVSNVTEDITTHETYLCKCCYFFSMQELAHGDSVSAISYV